MEPFKVSIPKPCNQDWNNMTLASEGRFCGVCSKTVIDFTNMSDAEIKAYFLNLKGTKICGHYRLAQTNEKKKISSQFFLFAQSRLSSGTQARFSIFILGLLSFLLSIVGCRPTTTGEPALPPPDRDTIQQTDSTAISDTLDVLGENA